MSFVIRGLGIAHPPDAINPEEGLGIARRLAGPDVRMSSWLGPVYANSGITRRFQILGGAVAQDVLNGTEYSASPFLPSRSIDGVGPTTAERLAIYRQEASLLAVQASVNAVNDARVPATAITHLITVSCTGFSAPGVDLAIITALGLQPTVQRTHIGFMGCHGALNGLRVARALTTADPTACVLVCAVELCSLHYYYGNAADKLIANAIFADGAAAVIGTNANTDLFTPENKSDCSPDNWQWRLLGSGSVLIPDSSGDMAWTIGDHGFEMTLSRRVPSLIARHLRPWLETWLANQGLALSDIRSWAVHPGGPRILDAVEESLALPPDALTASRWVFANYGNMSSPTVLFVINQLRESQAPRPCVALGFGPGLVAEVALLG
jgi:predicted naringenin-chalcone synthase